MGFLPPDDEHIKATVLGIADELTREGLVLRYRVEGADKVSLPSTERAVVDMLSALSLIKLTTVSAVSPLDPLAIANRVPTVFGIWCAR